jgi:hypothetical protein
VEKTHFALGRCKETASDVTKYGLCAIFAACEKAPGILQLRLLETRFPYVAAGTVKKLAH